MTRQISPYMLRLASSHAEVAAAQALRYQVFVEELGGRGGGLTDAGARIEADRYDEHCGHLLILDAFRENAVVGTTRVLGNVGATQAGGFASEEEFDLETLHRSGRRLLEVGRTCLHPDHRGGSAMHRLWQGLADLVEEQGVNLLFGLASFPGTDVAALAQPISCLHRDFLAPEVLRPRSRAPVDPDLLPSDRICRREAMPAMPALLKAYLRLGGRVGEGVFVDPTFGCTDVCMVLDTALLSDRARRIYAGEPQ